MILSEARMGMHQLPLQHRKTTIVSQWAALAACLTLRAAPAEGLSGNHTLDLNAIDALHRMGSYLRSLDRFSVDATTMLDEVLCNGEFATVGGTVSYLVRTPDKLRAELRTDRKQRQLFYDGRTLTIYAPRMHYYAQEPAPSTITATMDTARTRYEIDFALVDLFLWGTPRDGGKDLISAKYIGPGYIDGVDVDQFAFLEKGTDWQLWIQRGNTPVPRRIIITNTSNSARPRYVVSLRWNLAPVMTDAVFAFVPSAGVQRIALAHRDGGRSQLVAVSQVSGAQRRGGGAV